MIRPLGTDLQLVVDRSPERPSDRPKRREPQPLPTVEPALRALFENHGRIRCSANALGISRHQLRRLMLREGLSASHEPTGRPG